MGTSGRLISDNRKSKESFEKLKNMRKMGDSRVPWGYKNGRFGEERGLMGRDTLGSLEGPRGPFLGKKHSEVKIQRFRS